MTEGACCAEAGQCASGFPGAADVCSVECGQIFEPFWDDCGDMLISMGMGGMEGMTVFYEHCFETLYPPGSCGVFCNQHSYDCRLGQIREACCAHDNCDENGIPTRTCPVGCALIFPVFVEECGDHIVNVEHKQIAPYQRMEESCLTVDGAAIVEYARDLMQQGCSLDFGRHRRLQIVSQWLAPGSSSCTWDDLDDRSREVDQICCSDSSCQNGIPNVCTPMCAVVFHEFMDECGGSLRTILGGDGRNDQLTAFEDLCIGNLDTHLFLEAIANANCGDEVLGRQEECQEASELSITFLSSTRDTSGNNRRVSLNGDATVTTTGVQFDGDGDYFTVSSFPYASDSDFSISFWFVKQECTASLYEYLFSHSNDDSMNFADGAQQPGFASISIYLGCEGQGASTTSNDNSGTIMRYWMQDDLGTVGIFDFPLHDAGAFDSITQTWIHTILVVEPTGFVTYDDGTKVMDGLYGFPRTQPNVAQPTPGVLSSPFTTMTMRSPLYIGGRSDLAGDRHFRGTMALLMIDHDSITAEQAQCYFEHGESTLAALPPVPPPADHGMSCHMAVTQALHVTLGENGQPSMAARECTDEQMHATCDGSCGAMWGQIGTACANWSPEGQVVNCGTLTSRGVAPPCTTQRQQATYNQMALQQLGTTCAPMPAGCEPGVMMPIVQSCNLPTAARPVSADWRPRCPCDSSTVAPLIACADSFGASVGMDRAYINAVRRAAQGPCQRDSSGADFVTIQTDGTEVPATVEDEAGVFVQFHADAGTTYLLDTETGSLEDTVMFLLSTDQRTTIAENDDDERESGRLDSYIEWTCPETGMYYVNVKGYGGDTGTVTISIDTQSEAGDGPCSSGGAELHQQQLVISFEPAGGTANDQTCSWHIVCDPGTTATVTIQRFGTEQDFDYVRLYDGDSNSADAVAELTGAMRDLQQTTFTSSSTDMVVEFTSDESVGDEGFEASYLCSRDAPPPPPPGPVFVPISPGGGMTQGNVDSEAGSWFVFDATIGNTYQLETQAGSLEDTMMDLVDMDGQTTLVENDDDTRRSGSLASYIEWTCPRTGTYYVNVKGYGGSTGNFQVSVSAPSQEDPCGGGVTMNEQLATVSFMPQGGTQNDQSCTWAITCPQQFMHVELTFSRFDTESYFDTVTVFDGADADATQMGSLSGALSDLPTRDYHSAGPNMFVEFVSDDSITGLGFEANYICSSSQPPPPPEEPPPPPPGVHSFVTVATDGTTSQGEVTNADGIWYQFTAEQGKTYELDTEVGTLLDTVMDLVDLDGLGVLAENDDDERLTGRLDSYIEWTCPTSGQYYANVKGYGEDTGTFTFSITETSASGIGGGDPCDGGATLV